MELEILLIIDIETVPGCWNYEDLDATGQQLWREKSARYPDLNGLSPETAYREKAGILAEFGKVVCISVAYFGEYGSHNRQLLQKTWSNTDEKILLKQFSDWLTHYTVKKRGLRFAGHNIREFDIPYLCRRLLANSLPLPPVLYLHGQKPWEVNHLDTLHWWRFGDYKHYSSLKLLAWTLNLGPAKEGMDGSRVAHVYYEEKNLARIAEYCASDVQLTAKLILFFLKQERLPASQCIEE
jgi:3'-5' exonuclease